MTTTTKIIFFAQINTKLCHNGNVLNALHKGSLVHKNCGEIKQISSNKVGNQANSDFMKISRQIHFAIYENARGFR